MLGLNLADLLYVIGMIELLLFGVGVWWLRCHIISHHCSLLCEVCFFFFFFGLQDSCPFLSSKTAFRTPDEPEVRRNNGLMCMQ